MLLYAEIITLVNDNDNDNDNDDDDDNDNCNGNDDANTMEIFNWTLRQVLYPPYMPPPIAAAIGLNSSFSVYRVLT